MSISTQLRNFKEPTKDELTEIFFSIPPRVRQDVVPPSSPISPKEKSPKIGEEKVEDMEINAVLSLSTQGDEESYVRFTHHHCSFLDC